MRVWIDHDEWYPCYSAFTQTKYGSAQVEITPERYQAWQRAQDEWQSAQDDMEEAMKNDRAK